MRTPQSHVTTRPSSLTMSTELFKVRTFSMVMLISIIQIWTVTNFWNLLLLCSEKTINLKEDVDGDLLRSMREGEPMQLSGGARRPAQENDAIPKIAPKWLKHDRQVSKFQNPQPFTGTVNTFSVNARFCVDFIYYMIPQSFFLFLIKLW